jgi:alkylhydroperoxidase family enzyme
MDAHADSMARLTDAVLETPGATALELRWAIEAHAARLGGRAGEADAPVPAELLPYVDKVARHAHRVTDADIEQLRAGGYSDDAIFELTVAAALGAARARLERGLEALQ